MGSERNQGRRGLGKILNKAIYCGAAILLITPAIKLFYNNIVHNHSEVAGGIEIHSFAVGLDSRIKYSKFNDGIEQIEVYAGSLDRLARTGPLPFDFFNMRSYDGGDKIQEIRIIGGKNSVPGLSTIKTRDDDYYNYIESFNYGDMLLALSRYRAETRKANEQINQGGNPILFRF